VTPPALEIADLIRTAGPAFVERNRQWIRWKHVKVLLAVARCRVRPHSAGISMNAPAAHIALPSRITAAVTATAPSSIKGKVKRKNVPLSHDKFLRRFLLHLLSASLCAYPALRFPGLPTARYNIAPNP